MKLGPHIIQPNATNLDWARRAPIVKALGCVEPLQAAPWSAIKIFRWYMKYQNLDDPNGTVDQIIAALKGYHPQNLYIEFWNETHPNLEQLRAAVDRAHTLGYKVAAPCWSTETCTQEDWAIAKAAGVDLIAIHCYWGFRGFTLDNALRYRQFWRPGDPPVVITECGMDAVEGAKAGWKANGLPAVQYTADLLAYNTEISKDHYVLGATPFTCGPTDDWAAFNCDEIIPYLLGGTVDNPTPNVQDQIKQLLDQNRLLTDALKALRQGKFTGADGIDGIIVALQGGQKLDFTPSYPPDPKA